MANKVLTVFEGDAKQFFNTADAVEARIKRLSSIQSPAFGASAALPSAQGINPTTASNAPLIRAITSQTTATIALTTELGKQRLLNAAAGTGPASPAAGASNKSLANSLGSAAGFAIGTVIGGATILSIKEYVEATEAAEARTRSLRAELIGLGVDAAQAAADSRRFARENNLSLDAAAQVYAKSLQLARTTAGIPTEIAKAAADVGTLRNISPEETSKALDDINQGLVSTALFGRNAESVLDRYAASLGTTASQLTQSQKTQAQFNELLKQGAENAGLASENINSLGGSIAHIKNSIESLFSGNAQKGSATSGIASGFAAIGDFITDPFNFLKVGRERREKLEEDQRQRRIREEQDRAVNAQLVNQANTNPLGNIQNFAINRFLDQQAFGGLSATDQNERINEAVTKAREFKTNLVNELNRAVSSGDTSKIKTKLIGLDIYKSLFSDDEFAEAGKRAAETISRNLRDGLERNLSQAKTVPALQALSQQIKASVDLTQKDRDSLLDGVTRKIEAEIEKQLAAVRRMADQARSAVESVFARSSSRNPYLQLLDEIDKRTRALRENTRGLGADITNALLGQNAKQDNLDLLNLRFNSRSSAFNLRDEANAFDRFKTFGSTDSLQVQSIKGFIAAQGEMTPFWKNYWDGVLKEVQKQDFQERLNQQINIARQSFLQGPAGDTNETRSLFNQEVIKLTPISQVDQFSPQEINQAIQSRQEEAQHQLSLERQAADDRQAQIAIAQAIDSKIDGLLKLAQSGKLNAFVKFINKSDRVEVTTTGSQEDVNGLYGNGK